jgi:hypothetical protein
VYVACTEEMRNAYKFLVRKSEGKRPFESTKYRFEDSINMDIRGIRYEGVD